MKSEQAEAMIHRLVAASLASLMRLPPPGSSTRFTVASACMIERDPAFDQLMQTASLAKLDVLVAVFEKRKVGTSGPQLVLITTEDGQAKARNVDVVSLTSGKPAVLVSMDRKEAWEFRTDRLVRATPPSPDAIRGGIAAAAAEFDRVLINPPAYTASLRAHQLGAYHQHGGAR